MAQTLQAPKEPTGYDPASLPTALRRVVLGWAFGSMFFSVTTGAAFTSFLKQYLQIGDFGYGLIMAAGPAAVAFNLFGSLSVERSGRSKPNFMRFLIFGRVVWLAIASIPLFRPEPGALWAVGAVGMVVFVSNMSANYGGAGFIVWMSALVPKASGGGFFGHRARVGLLMMVLASSVVSVLLDRFPGNPMVYTAVFGFAVAVGIADILCFVRVPEVPRAIEEHPPSLASIIATPWKDPKFRRYSTYTMLSFSAYMMFWPFMWPFCFEPPSKHGLGLSLPLTNLLIVVLPQLANAYTAPFWGRAIDRFGPKPVLGFGAISAIVLPAFWLIAQNRYGLELTWLGQTRRFEVVMLIPLVTILGGLTWPSIDQGIFYIQLHGFPEARRSAYIAANTLVMGWAAMVGSAVGGLIASSFLPFVGKLAFLPSWFSHYQAVFFVSIAIRLLSFVFFFRKLEIEGEPVYFQAAASVGDEALGPIRRVLPQKWWAKAKKRR